MELLQVPVNHRRRRRVDDEDDEETSTRATTPLSQSSNGSKRARLDGPVDRSGDEDEDESEDVENDRNGEGQNLVKVLPAGSRSQGTFQPGAIVRMKLKDFVTYTKVEYYFGPMLNMIIGPNGTGKSTLHLGRAKEASEFVKHGCKEAVIEIELAGGPNYGKNPVIRRVIKVEGNKSTFTIDGVDVTRNKVMKFAQKFSIQIDNLCQFLPQDKVSEFAALTPVELLASTQRAAAGPQMLEWHNDLIRLRAGQKKLLADNKSDRDLLTNLENRQELQRADVERIQERAKIKRLIEMLEFYRPVAAYLDYRKRLTETKAKKREIEGAYKQLEDELAPALQAVNEKRDYLTRTDSLVEYKRQKFAEAESAAKEVARRMDTHEESLKNLTSQIEAEKKTGKIYKQDMNKIQQAINRITRQMEEKPEEFDIDSYNDRIRTLQREMRDIESRAREIRAGRQPIYERLHEKRGQIHDAEREINNLNSKSGQREALLKKLSPDTYQAHRWVLENADKFEHEVFGPALITCSVKDTNYADAIESLLQKNDFTAFTTQSLRDFRTLQRALNVELKLHDVSIRNCSTKLSDFKPQISDEELRSLGFDGWAKDFLVGPDPVLAMLCNEQYLFRTPIVLREISDQEYARMESHNAINSWVAGKQTYKVNRRKEYGPGATSTQVRQVRPARFWTNQPLDVSMKQDLLDSIEQNKNDIVEIQKEIDAAKAELARIGEENTQKKTEKTELERQKSEKQTALLNFRALPEKLSAYPDNQEAKKRDLDKSFETLRARVRSIRGKQDQIAIEKAETAIEYAEAVEILRQTHEDLVQAHIRSIEALSDFENLKDRNQEIEQTLNAKRKDLENAIAEVEEVSRRAGEARNKASATMTTLQTQPDMVELFGSDEYRNISADQLEANIDSAKASLELTHEGSESIVKEFEDRQKAIDKLQDKLSSYQEKLADHEIGIREIRSQWEPRLDALVKTISDAFSDSFARIGCAGQVTIDKVEDEPGPNGEPGGSDFDQWSIQIQVKFRETENLSVLDSHRQSGGERAVSTIFYLMALQSLSASPFRVVDEINQGMDPRNERMVHERMVDIACAPRNPSPTADGLSGGGGSQYFLITPKVLSGLYYSNGIRVQCIASGEHVPSDFHMTDFRHAVQIMDNITGRAPRAIRSGIAGDTRQGRGINHNGGINNSTTPIYG
ncbi:hypothetical protein UA08_02896 [Talaromyces atroroseus]|uniref:Structural maintenance of chromosomes protein 5 n=1 Tax=Talaromyces atroroseus TaxID=1441469 RepID=A0A225AJR3_TALAT|nr:hypothetical protein UA08_02896 [Talaromyces atroroseus]OKL61752.1 hypothetical protein UA08_02896 [Talaromyces atroroseus]